VFITSLWFLCFRLVNFTAQFSVSIAVILMPNFLCHYNAHVITIKQFLVSCIIIRICLAQLFHYTFAAICHALLKSFECRFMFALVYMPHLIHRLVSSIVTSLDLRCSSCLYAVGFSLQRRRSGLLMVQQPNWFSYLNTCWTGRREKSNISSVHWILIYMVHILNLIH
jgi:hypothetical protein